MRLSQNVRWLILTGSLAIAGPIWPAGWAAESDPADVAATRKRFLDWDTGANQSYVIPAVEIPAFLATLSLYDRSVYGNDVYGATTRSTSSSAATPHAIRRNIRVSHQYPNLGWLNA